LWSTGPGELALDHCEFTNSHSFLVFEGTGYVRNSIFRNLGEEWGFGSVALGLGDVEVTDCWFYDNAGFGLWLYDYSGSISGSNFVANSWGGICGESSLTNAIVTCSEFAYNGGDSTAEITVNGSTLNLGDNAGCIFADRGGTLLSGTEMSNFELAGGGNGFFLYDSTGTYVETGDQTDTLDISGNYWYPFSPDTSAFWDRLSPDTSRFWTVDSIAEAVAACGEYGAAGMHDGLPRTVRAGLGDGTIAGMRSGSGTGVVSLSKAKLVHSSQDAAADESIGLAKLAQRNRDYAAAAVHYRRFIAEHPDDERMTAALSGYFQSARKSNQVAGLARFYADIEQRVTDPSSRQTAHELSLKALALEGQPQAALNGFEQLMESATNRRDSVRAAIASMDLQFHYGHQEPLLSAHPENHVTTFKEFARRAMALSAMLVRDQRKSVDSRAAEVPIPREYKLYQNFPNPFNPNTEIRFDLPEAVNVQLRVYNILGQEVTTLLDAVKPAGAYHLTWDSKNAAGSVVASGVYVYQLKAGKFVDAKKMVLIR
jgi:hypothetical protein